MKTKKILSWVVLFAVLITGLGLYRDSKYAGANTRIIHTSNTSPAYIEVRKIYPRDGRYWIFGTEPYVYGYYITVFPAPGVPPDGVFLIHWPSEPSTIDFKVTGRRQLSVYFDGQIILGRNNKEWTVSGSP